MDTAHFHLIVNHLPIVGLLIGILTLLTGLLLKKSEVKLTALGIIIFSAIASVFAFYTGEGAEEIVEQMAGMSKSLIHEHEELAESFFTLTLITGAIAIVAFIAELKKLKFAPYLIIFVLILGISDMILAKYVSTSGGEIRHTEIREDALLLPTENDRDD